MLKDMSGFPRGLFSILVVMVLRPSNLTTLSVYLSPCKEANYRLSDV